LALDTRGDELCFRSQPSSLCFETIFQSFGLLKAIALNHGASPLLIRRERNLAFSSPIKAKIPRGDNEDYFSKDGGDTTNVRLELRKTSQRTALKWRRNTPHRWDEAI
jgi:hypothetical protein